MIPEQIIFVSQGVTVHGFRALLLELGRVGHGAVVLVSVYRFFKVSKCFRLQSVRSSLFLGCRTLETEGAAFLQPLTRSLDVTSLSYTSSSCLLHNFYWQASFILFCRLVQFQFEISLLLLALQHFSLCSSVVVRSAAGLLFFARTDVFDMSVRCAAQMSTNLNERERTKPINQMVFTDADFSGTLL